MEFKTSWLPHSFQEKPLVPPFFPVLLVSIAEHGPTEPREGCPQVVPWGLLSTSTQRLLGQEHFCQRRPFSAPRGWFAAEAVGNSVHVHEPGVCFCSLCANQSVTRSADGCVQILPKSLLRDTSHKIQKTSETLACLNDFPSSCEWP